MSDMGVEFGIANFGNALGQILGDKFVWDGDAVPWTVPEAQAGEMGSYMYPFALQTPGVLHIVDWIIRSTIEQLSWWPVWQLECKRLLQFCHGQAHRDRLRLLIEELAPQGQSGELARSLDVATGRFAEWRWKTLSRAVKDLGRIEGALRFLSANIDSFSSVLASRDASGMQHLQSTCASPEFWDRSKAISSLIGPLMEFMGWLQGCDCHDDQLQSGQIVACPLKGCRAKNLSARLELLCGQFRALREALRPDSFGSVDSSAISLAIAHSLASIKLKFMWVDELPYLVWQVPL